MRRLIIAFCAALLLCLPPSSLKAEERLPGEKSMSTVWTLSALPINGPALMYVDHAIQGTVVTVAEVSGLLIFSIGAFGECTGGDQGDCDALAIGAMIAGGALWLPAYIYALIRAPRYAKQHNQKIRAQHSTISPWVSFRNDEENTKTFGLAFSF